MDQVRFQLIDNEIAACIQTLRSLLDNLNKSAWNLSIQSCLEAEVRLSRLGRYIEFNSEELARISRAVDDLKLVHDQIEIIRREKQRGGQLSSHAHWKLNEMVLFLSRIGTRLVPQAGSET